MTPSIYVSQNIKIGSYHQAYLNVNVFPACMHKVWILMRTGTALLTLNFF